MSRLRDDNIKAWRKKQTIAEGSRFGRAKAADFTRYLARGNIISQAEMKP